MFDVFMPVIHSKIKILSKMRKPNKEVEFKPVYQTWWLLDVFLESHH